MNNKITYHKEGDYLIPDLYFPKQPEGNIGKYGRLRLNYLKEHKRVSCIINKFAEIEGIDENLKQTNQMQWVQAMNNIKNRAEEIVYNEIIYV